MKKRDSSKFNSQSTAISAIESALIANSNEISKWLLDDNATSSKSLTHKINFSIGKGYSSGGSSLDKNLQGVFMLIKKDRNSETGFSIVTAYPRKQ
ncbi:RNase A-like domain-containing protein [Metabacillus sp. SLBN-84]